MTTANPANPVKETLFRGGRAQIESEQVKVSRDGGDSGAGLLSGVSLISTGEALGHEMWIDDVTLEQVSEFASRGNHGVKSRFTHPSMSADGMGRHLGRIKDVRVDGDRVIGDLHFAESAHKTPDGDLASYVMDLAEEDPQAAGLSIVFEHDPIEEMAFFESYSDDSGEFSSPDPNNVNGYPHVRLSKLRAADVVDEPAANPEGLFDRQTLPRDVDELLSYAAGLSEDKPKQIAFGVDADRATQFLTRWLDSHGLSLTQKAEEQPMSADVKAAAPETPVEPQPTREEFLSELSRYTEKFGAEDGQKWFQEGKEYSEALELHCEKLQSQIDELETSLADAEARINSVDLGEETPIDTGVSDEGKSEKKTFASRIRIASASKN